MNIVADKRNLENLRLLALPREDFRDKVCALPLNYMPTKIIENP
jgi:hypothetical protein